MSNSNKINLLQMQKYFEGQTSRIRLISDLMLSENDYRSLGAKLKALCFFTGSENDIEDYMLSVVVYSTYSLIYGNEDDKFDAILQMIMNNSQYMERTYFRMFVDVFHAYGLSTFGVKVEDPRTTCQTLVARHAGVPDTEKNAFFDLISEYIDCNDEEYMCEQIYEREPVRAKRIVGLLDKDLRSSMILDARQLVSDVMDGMMNRNQLLEKYPELSINAIDHCIMWNECNKHRIRHQMQV